MSNQFNGTSETEVSPPIGRSKQRPQRYRSPSPDGEDRRTIKRIMRAAELSRPGYEVAYDPDQGVYRVSQQDCSSRVKERHQRAKSALTQGFGGSGNDHVRAKSSRRKLDFTAGEPDGKAEVSETHPAKRVAYGRDYAKGDSEIFVAGRSHARISISAGAWPAYSGPKINPDGKRAYRAHIDELFDFLQIQLNSQQLEFLRGIGFEYCAQLAALESQSSADKRWTTYKAALKAGNYTMAFACLSSIHYRIQDLLKDGAETQSD